MKPLALYAIAAFALASAAPAIAQYRQPDRGAPGQQSGERAAPGSNDQARNEHAGDYRPAGHARRTHLVCHRHDGHRVCRRAAY